MKKDPRTHLTRVKSRSPADELEAQVRAQYLPGKIMGVLAEILDIETNALWRATPEGLQAAHDDEGYSPDELSAVLLKQDAHKKRLRVKVDFLKRTYDCTFHVKR